MPSYQYLSYYIVLNPFNEVIFSSSNEIVDIALQYYQLVLNTLCVTEHGYGASYCLGAARRCTMGHAKNI